MSVSGKFQTNSGSTIQSQKIGKQQTGTFLANFTSYNLPIETKTKKTFKTSLLSLYLNRTDPEAKAYIIPFR